MRCRVQLVLLLLILALLSFSCTEPPQKQPKQIRRRIDLTLIEKAALNPQKDPALKNSVTQHIALFDIFKDINMEQLKKNVESIFMRNVEKRLTQDSHKAIQWLIEVATQEDADGKFAPLNKKRSVSIQKQIAKTIKCRSNASSGEIPGDRLEINYTIEKEDQVSFSIEGGAICENQKKTSAITQLVLGVIYQEGRGIPQDYQKALYWYKKAAKNEFAHANHYLGTMYHKGQGVEQSYTEATKYYRKAAEQGLAVSQNSLGNMYYNGLGVKKKFEEAVKYYRKSAEQKYALAQNNLGFMYEEGYGVKLDYIQASKWYRKAAAKNYVVAQYNLGNIYSNGYPYGYDFSEAYKWYRKAAENGYAPAQKILGILFQMGRGVAQNYGKAVKWFKLAAEQEDVEAIAHLGFLYEHGLGLKQDKNKAQALYLSIAQQADADTLFFLGVGWENDDHQPNDNIMAYLWYSLSAYKGVKQARLNCSTIIEKMTASQILTAEQNSRMLIEEIAYDG